MFVGMKDAGTNKGAVCVSENSCIIQVLGKESNMKMEFKTFSCLQPVTGILLSILFWHYKDNKQACSSRFVAQRSNKGSCGACGSMCGYYAPCLMSHQSSEMIMATSKGGRKTTNPESLVSSQNRHIQEVPECICGDVACLQFVTSKTQR